MNQVDAARAAGVKRFVYVSGVGAAPDASKHWFRFKWQAEEHLRSSGLEWVIVRPTWVYGPRDVSLNRLLDFANFLPFVPMFGDGKQAMQPVFVDDVGRVVATAATKPEAANQLFELGGPEVMSDERRAQGGPAGEGKKRPILHQPMFVGKAIGTVMSLLPITPPLTADAVDFIASPAVADTRNLRGGAGAGIDAAARGVEDVFKGVGTRSQRTIRARRERALRYCGFMRTGS